MPPCIDNKIGIRDHENDSATGRRDSIYSSIYIHIFFILGECVCNIAIIGWNGGGRWIRRQVVVRWCRVDVTARRPNFMA
jgi:hypothetical protein